MQVMILVEIFFYAIITKKPAKRRVFIVAGAIVKIINKQVKEYVR